jgi:predicted enzyme related to lactoylglutathione lyase
MRPGLPLLLAALVFTGCATSPSSAPLGRQDLVSGRPAASLDFYREVFGWTAAAKPYGYWELTGADGRPVGGLISLPKAGEAASWLTTLDVDHLDATLSRVEAEGGNVIHGPVPVAGGARTAVISGPDGARLQVREGSSGGREGPWVWHELVTRDVGTAATWYRKVFGFETEPVDDTERMLLLLEGKAVAAVSPNPFEEADAQWIPVLEVRGLSTVLDAITAQGGQVLKHSTDTGRSIALVADPHNAPFLLQETGEGSP